MLVNAVSPQTYIFVNIQLKRSSPAKYWLRIHGAPCTCPEQIGIGSSKLRSWTGKSRTDRWIHEYVDHTDTQNSSDSPWPSHWKSKLRLMSSPKKASDQELPFFGSSKQAAADFEYTWSWLFTHRTWTRSRVAQNQSWLYDLTKWTW